MCLTCGCGDTHNDHGDPKNITIEALRTAAEAGGVTLKEAAENIRRAMERERMVAGSR